MMLASSKQWARSRRRFLGYGVLFVGSAVVSACGGDRPTANNSPANTTEPSEGDGDFGVAILLPQTIDDGSWSEAGYRGLEQIQQELGARISYVENIDFMDQAAVTDEYRKLAEAGYQFIIGHGSQHLTLPAAETIAAEFPRTQFAVVAGQGPGNNNNLGILNFQDAELGYLAGVVAGLKTQSGTVSFIGGFDYPNLVMAADRYTRGVQSQRPNATVLVDWLDSWTDGAKAKATAQQHIAAGADIIAVNAEPAGLPIHSEAAALGIHTIGWYQDQYERSPDRILTSAVQKIDVLLLTAATLVRRGQWEGRQYYLGLADGAIALAPFREALTAEEAAQVEAIQEAIITGEIDVLS
jgi:basic membrane protein A